MEKGQCVGCEVLKVLCQAPASIEPGERPFDHPSPRQHLEALRVVRSLDDVDGKLRHHLCDSLAELCALIACVGKQLDQEWILPEQTGQHENPAVPILHVRRMHHSVQQKTYRVDQDVALAAFDLLASVITDRVNHTPPFSVLLTLWLSMTHAVGLVSRSACSRHLT